MEGRKLQAPEARIRWLTQAEAAALILAAEAEPMAPHLADFIRLALNTGCRRGELLWMEWPRVDLQGRLMHLEGHHTKAGNEEEYSAQRGCGDRHCEPRAVPGATLAPVRPGCSAWRTEVGSARSDAALPPPAVALALRISTSTTCVTPARPGWQRLECHCPRSETCSVTPRSR